jgi:HK97 family phage portal protein
VRSLIGTIVNKAPVSFTQQRPSIYSAQPRNDATGQMMAMGAVGTLFAITSRLANATSQVDWKLYRKAASGRPEDRVEVTRHLALQIWNKPNDFMTRQEFVESFQQHVDLTGEGWLVVERDSRATFPTGLWYVRPDRIDPVPDPVDFLSGYVYTSPDGQKVPLERNEVIQLRMPNPLTPYRGMGPVQSVMLDVESARYSAEYNRNFFKNSAEPGGIIEMPDGVSDDDFNEMRDRWNEQHRGVSGAHRVAILEGGAKWVDRKYTQRDMQFVELSGLSSEKIREAFAFPKPLLGSVDDVNRANAEAGEVVFARWLIVPRLERIKQALNNDFLPLFGSTGQGLEFDYCNPVPEDQVAENEELTARSNAASTLINAGLDPVGVLSAVGLPEIAYVRTAPQPAQLALPAPGGAP